MLCWQVELGALLPRLLQLAERKGDEQVTDIIRRVERSEADAIIREILSS